jgi:prolyl 4-hydroxylase
LAGFLSDDECDALMALAAPRLARSETVDNDTGGSEVNAARTSDGMFFERGEHPLICASKRASPPCCAGRWSTAKACRCCATGPAPNTSPHHDYFDPAQPGAPRILLRAAASVWAPW